MPQFTRTPFGSRFTFCVLSFAFCVLTSLAACERSTAPAAPPPQASATPAAVTPTTAPTVNPALAGPGPATTLPANGAFGPQLVSAAPAPAPVPTPAANSSDQSSDPSLADNLDPTTGKTRIPHPPAKPGEVAVMTIKELGNFNFDPNKDDKVPADVQALNGSTVRLRGFMLALTQATEITDFALMPTLGNCCYGVPAGVQHTITCRIPKNKALNYVMDEVSVEGKLTVKVKREDGYTYSIFELDVTSVKLAQ